MLQWKPQLRFINFISPNAMRFRGKKPKNIWDEKQKANSRALCFNSGFGLFLGFFWCVLCCLVFFFKEYQLKQKHFYVHQNQHWFVFTSCEFKSQRIFKGM